MSQPSQLPAIPSPQAQLALQYLKALSQYDIDQVSSFTTDNFTQTTLPASLDVAARSKAEDLDFLKQLQSTLGGNPLQCLVQGSAPSGLALDVEAIYLFAFVGVKVEGIKEFADSKAFLDFFAAAAAEEGQGATA